jgi:hypothetical protein
MATKSVILKEVMKDECFCFPVSKTLSGLCKYCFTPLKTFPRWGICLCEGCKIICKKCGVKDR